MNELDESAASRFLREQAEQGRSKEPAPVEPVPQGADVSLGSEPAKGTSWAELDGAAFLAAYEQFRDFLAFDFQAPDGHASTIGQFVRDADQFGWRFTSTGELIEDGEEPA